MADEEVPAHRVVLAGKAMERQHVVVVGQAVDSGLILIGAGKLTRARFEEQDAVSSLGEPWGQGPPASPEAEPEPTTMYQTRPSRSLSLLRATKSLVRCE